MAGEWEHNGKRRAWREVFSRTGPTSVVQTLDIGEPGRELKRVSAINATNVKKSSTQSMDMPPAENGLRAAMAERHRAMLAGDAEAVEHLTADDYMQTDIFGHVQDKSAWLAEYFRPLAALIKAGKFRWETYEEKDVQTRVLGDTAIVIGSLTLKGIGARPSGHTWGAFPQSSVGEPCVSPASG